MSSENATVRRSRPPTGPPETLLREAIAQKFPDDAILGEEFGEKTGSSDFRWLLDPIDGTKAFITGVPMYTTLIGIMAGREPRAGVIHAPAAGETVYAGPDGPCWYRRDDRDPTEARVSSTTSLDEATFVTSSVMSYVKERDPGEYDAYQRLESAVRLTRTWGDAFGYLLVATGRADIMVDPAMDLWDSAALQPIVEAAGGTYTDWNGVASVHSPDSVATNGHLHEQVLAVLRG